MGWSDHTNAEQPKTRAKQRIAAVDALRDLFDLEFIRANTENPLEALNAVLPQDSIEEAKIIRHDEHTRNAHIGLTATELEAEHYEDILRNYETRIGAIEEMRNKNSSALKGKIVEEGGHVREQTNAETAALNAVKKIQPPSPRPISDQMRQVVKQFQEEHQRQHDKKYPPEKIVAAKKAIATLRELGPITKEEAQELNISAIPNSSSPWAKKIGNGRDSGAISLSL